MKKSIIISILIVLLFLYGCGPILPDSVTDSFSDQVNQEQTTTSKDQKSEETIVDEPIVEETNIKSPSIQEDDFGSVFTDEVCDVNNVNPSDLDHLSTSFHTKGVQYSEEGFTFTFEPIDEIGNIMPLEGNLAVHLYWTEIQNNERKSQSIAYSMQKYIKLDDVNPDCTPQTVTVSFDKIKSAAKYSSVTEDDPGFIRIVFKRTGSSDEFTDEYMPKEGEKLFP